MTPIILSQLTFKNITMKKSIISRCIAILLIAVLMGCNKDDVGNQFGIFKVLNDEKTVEMNGTINSSSLKNFTSLASTFPNIVTINIKNCDGSSDDEVNLKLSQEVHKKGINTHLLNNAEIASGGVDFFVAGIKRTRGTNTSIGVHSWGGEDDNGNNVTATDFPVGHEYHLAYINYYVSVGFTQANAEAFYYFTINSASADEIHWMTEEEITQYKLLTE